MRSFFHRALVIGCCAGALVLGSGCERKQQTEYVTGVSTQVSVPRDLKAIRLQVSTAGVSQFCRSYAVYNGKVLLPRSLGTFSQSATANSVASPITYSILGIAEDFSDSSANPVFTQDCTVGQVNSDNVRVLRRSTQPYILDEILLLPMPLKYSCFDVKCGDNETCKGGTCVSDVTDPATLARYNGDLGEGADSNCFSTALCMGAAIPAIETEAATCTFALPQTKDAPAIADPKNDPFRGPCATVEDCNGGKTPEPNKGRQCTNGACDFLPLEGPPWTGLNVEITYDGAFTKEILDIDPVEGFSIPDPQKPQQFRLAPGLCAMLKGVDSKGQPTAHRITGVRASGTCTSKKMSQPICLPDALKAMGATSDGTAPATAGQCNVQALVPPRAALMIVVDNTPGHASFFNDDKIKTVAVPLNDPALGQTDVGLLFAGSANTCGSAPTVAVAPEAASSTLSDKIKSALSAAKPDPNGSPKPSFESALSQAYLQLRNLPGTYARRGVLVVGNREFGVDECAAGDGVTPSTLASANFADPAKPVRTYALQLTGEDVDQPQRDGLRIAGSGANYPTIVTSSNPLAAVDAFQQIVNDLATCTYNFDPAKFGDDTQLYYGNGLTGSPSELINRDNACSPQKVADANAPGGWNYANPEKTSIVICDKACLSYRDVLLKQAKFAAAYSQSPIAAPIYARSNGCAEKK